MGDTDLLAFYRRATPLRHHHAVLCTGRGEALYAVADVYAFRRVLDQQEAIVVFNTDSSTASLVLSLPETSAGVFSQAWPPDGAASHRIVQGRLDVTVPGREALVLVDRRSA